MDLHCTNTLTQVGRARICGWDLDELHMEHTYPHFIQEGNEAHGIEAVFARSFWFGGTIMYFSTAVA